MEIDRPYIAVHIDSDDRTTPHVHCVWRAIRPICLEHSVCCSSSLHTVQYTSHEWGAAARTVYTHSRAQSKEERQPWDIGIRQSTNATHIYYQYINVRHTTSRCLWLTVIDTLLANVNSRSRSLLYAIARPSVVCLWRSCTLLSRSKFSAIFLRHLVPWPFIDIHWKFYWDRPRGTPPSGV